MEYICKFCSSIRKNNNSLKSHEIRCNKNPDRLITPFLDPEFQKTKNGNISNMYIKAKKYGYEYTISEETREKLRKSSKDNTHSEYTRKKISESMKKAHSEGRAWNIGKSRWNNEPSYPEKFFANVIANEFIDKSYQTEFPIGIYSADFCWVHLKKVIEIDGEQHYRSKENIDRDLRKNQYLADQGFKILRIRWKDMFHNTKEKIKECFDFIHYEEFCHSPAESLSQYQNDKKNKCAVCGAMIYIKAKHCQKCFHLSRRKIDWLPYAELKKLVEETNYWQAGKKLGVSDNAIRKRLKQYEKEVATQPI